MLLPLRMMRGVALDENTFCRERVAQHSGAMALAPLMR